MKALELLKNQEIIFVEDNNTGKKVKTLITSFTRLMSAMKDKIESMEEFLSSQQNGELSAKIVSAKSYVNFFANNKHLKVESIVAYLQNQEKAKMNEYYAVKTQLLDIIRNIIKESSKEAVVSAYDVFEDEFKKCESGHEIIIFKDRNINVLEALLRELDEELILNGTFDSVEAKDVTFDSSTLTRNIDLCNRKNNEVYGAKQSKYNKLETIINHFAEAGKNVVAFYTHKENLLNIGCTPKGIKDYENELSKAYIPLKKTLQKEFKIELEDICNVSINEDTFPTLNIDTDSITDSSIATEGTEDLATITTISEPVQEATEEETATVTNLFETTPDINPIPSNVVNSAKKAKNLPHMFESLNNKVSSLIDADKKKDPFDSDK